MAAYISTSSTVEALVSQSCNSKESFQRDYWNIDDILAEEELVPCIFKVEAKGLGYLDQLQHLSSTATAKQRKMATNIRAQSLPAGTKVDVPVWLAVSLASREVVDLRNPKFMTPNYYAQLKAGPDVVTMRAMSVYIYEAVIKMSDGMNQEQAKEAVELYLAVFVDRFSKLIIDHSNQTAEGLAQAEDFSGTLAKKLTNLEKEIFDMHRKQKTRF